MCKNLSFLGLKVSPLIDTPNTIVIFRFCCMCVFVFPPKIVKNLMDCLWWNRLFCVQAYNFNHKWPQEPPTGRDRWFCLWTRWFDFPMIFLKIIESWFDLIFWKINMILFDLILSIFICLTALFFLPLRKTTLIKTTQLHALLLES